MGRGGGRGFTGPAGALVRKGEKGMARQKRPAFVAWILKGIKKDGRQVRDRWFALNRQGGIEGCCVMAACALGHGGIPVDKWRREVLARAVDRYDPPTKLPQRFTVDQIDQAEEWLGEKVDAAIKEAFINAGLNPNLVGLGVDLNDDAVTRLSREQIAERLAAEALRQ